MACAWNLSTLGVGGRGVGGNMSPTPNKQSVMSLRKQDSSKRKLSAILSPTCAVQKKPPVALFTFISCAYVCMRMCLWVHLCAGAENSASLDASPPQAQFIFVT